MRSDPADLSASGSTDAGQDWLRRLFGYCRRYPRSLVLGFISSAVAMGVASLSPLIVKQIVDEVILTRHSPLLPWLALLIGAGLIRACCSFARRYYAGRLGYQVDYALRTDLFDSLQRLDGAQQDRLRTGQVVSRATSDVTMVERLISMVPLVTSNLIMLVASLIIMAVLSPLLTIVALLMVPALFVVVRYGAKVFFPSTWDRAQQAGEVAGVVEAAVTGVRVVKGFGQEQSELRRLEAAAGTLFGAAMRVNQLIATYMPLFRMIPAVAQVGVLAFGGYLAMRGEITLGTFLAFSTYLAALFGPVMMFVGQLTQAQTTKAALVRIFEIIDARPVITDAVDAVAAPDGPATVELDSVTFGYEPDSPVLRSVSLSVSPGETLALVGGAGSGKSTVALLLARFYDPQSGVVRLSGADLRTLGLASLRSRIGMVFEDSFLFSDSVRANIAFGRPGASEADVITAARAAEAHEFILALEDGYDTVVGERGLTLSGGQRQRIALARAILTDPHVLVLDDATSAIDAGVEAEIHATLRRVMRGRTTLLIAHRRSTLQLADRIAVLHHGSVVDVGTHEELVSRCARYRLLLTGHDEAVEGVEVADDASALPDGDGAGGARGAAPLADAPGRIGEIVEQSYEGTREQVDKGARGRSDIGNVELSTAPNEVTPELWNNPPPEEVTGVGALGRMTLPPDQAAKVAGLPPAVDRPDVDLAAARQPDPTFGLRRLWRPFRRGILLGSALILLSALIQLVIPWLTKTGIDGGIRPILPHVLFIASAAALALVLADWLVSRIQVLVVGRTGERMFFWLRVKMYAHLQRLGLDYYERERGGHVMTRMTTDIESLTTFVQTGLSQLLAAAVSFFGVLGVMLVLDVQLTLAVIVLVPFFLAAALIYRRFSTRAYDAARDQLSAVNANFQENISGIRVAQAYGREGRNIEVFSELTEGYVSRQMKAQVYLAYFFSFIEFANELAVAIVLGASAVLVTGGSLTAGSIVAFLLYVTMLFSPLQQFSQVLDGYQRAKVGLGRIRELLHTPTTTPQASSPVAVSRLTGAISFESVRFSYSGEASSSDEALSGVRVSVAPGETVAIVGETGAGKSTMIKLVARFYDPTGGAVLIDGVDLRQLDLEGYRRRLGFVPQEAYLFNGSVRDAIAYGRPAATDAEVEQAAREVGAHAMVAALKHGYLHPVGERGHSLSAGQRQLLALARAQLVDPDILLLDEATASLDLATEAAVTAATHRLTTRRTTLVIAHRLTTAQQADRILVVSGGHVVEAGTHDALVAAGGTYASLWAAFTGDAEAAHV